jgi:hypothetical protein
MSKITVVFFLVSILSTTRNGFSLFSSCQREFIFFIIDMQFHPDNEQNLSRTQSLFFNSKHETD